MKQGNSRAELSNYQNEQKVLSSTTEKVIPTENVYTIKGMTWENESEPLKPVVGKIMVKNKTYLPLIIITAAGGQLMSAIMAAAGYYFPLVE